jgi:hypothetical protein
MMRDHHPTGSEQRAARAAGVVRPGGTDPESVDDMLVRYASSAYDDIDALLHATTRPMPAPLVSDLLGNLHALARQLPRLLTQLNSGLQRATAGPDLQRASETGQLTRSLAEAEAAANELARRLAVARAAADHHTRAVRSRHLM